MMYFYDCVLCEVNYSFFFLIVKAKPRSEAPNVRVCVDCHRNTGGLGRLCQHRYSSMNVCSNCSVFTCTAECRFTFCCSQYCIFLLYAVTTGTYKSRLLILAAVVLCCSKLQLSMLWMPALVRSSCPEHDALIPCFEAYDTYFVYTYPCMCMHLFVFDYSLSISSLL